MKVSFLLFFIVYLGVVFTIDKRIVGRNYERLFDYPNETNEEEIFVFL